MAKETTLPVPVTGPTDLVRPTFIPQNDARGTEHITKDDLQMPRLALAQGLTPQVAAGQEGFNVGMMFNSITEQVYGRGPIEFTILRADPPRFVEFIPRDEGGGIKDLNVPHNDPRTEFRTDPASGKTLPPLATKFYDYIIMMLPVNETDPMGNIIALSFKSSGLRVARQLNGLMKLRNAASFAGKYKLTTGSMTNSKGTFAVYQVQNAGWVDESTYHLAEQLFESLKDREIVIDRESGDEGADHDTDTDFPHGENAK